MAGARTPREIDKALKEFERKLQLLEAGALSRELTSLFRKPKLNKQEVRK